MGGSSAPEVITIPRPQPFIHPFMRQLPPLASDDDPQIKRARKRKRGQLARKRGDYETILSGESMGLMRSKRRSASSLLDDRYG